MTFTIIGVVGTRNTGKTTTLINLSRQLTIEGYKVVIMKFMTHKFDLDDESKDSNKFRQVNPSMIISASPSETVIFQPRTKRASVEELLPYIPKNTDFILCEGIPIKYITKSSVIFCSRDNDTYTELKKRYEGIKPIYISGLIANSGIKTLDNIPVLSTLKNEGLDKMVAKLRKLREDEISHT
ncbi:MAG: molybdopterin-guanine dinucleotide biosynthesis protein B [Candidatus Hodarchaeales archaeon]